MDMRSRSGLISRRSLLKTALVGAAAALLSDVAARPVLAAHLVEPAAEAPKQAGTYEVTFLTTQTNQADVQIYEDLSAAFAKSQSSYTVKVTAESGTNIDQK